MIQIVPATDACPACGHDNGLDLLRIDQVPVYCNELHRDPEAARNVSRGDLKLRGCVQCGLVFNAAFDSKRVDYQVEYENALHFSACFRDFQDSLASRLVNRYQLQRKRIVEIGCGDGTFLKLLCTRGANRGIGYEPAAAAPSRILDDPPVSIINDFFKTTDTPPDLICSRHVLEHVVDPRAMLQIVQEAISLHAGSRVYFEVPNAELMVKGGGVWDLLYEHCLYFTAASLKRLFESAGFVVLSCETCYGGQFLGIEAAGNDRAGSVEEDSHDLDDHWREQLLSFRSTYERQVTTWNARLQSLVDANQRVVAWGAGTKGTMFLNTISAAKLLPAIVDINPRKHDTFVAGTGTSIVAPEELRHLRPEIVIVMNPLYEQEVAQRCQQLGCSPEVLVA